jgi:prepilin-type N-terminal cleavage/methylation domain-containing protein
VRETILSRCKSRAGFTLIELLVVIAIIAILAAILFPIFAAAKNKAKETRCLSHMKQIAYALQMYVSDYNDVWPSMRIFGAGPTRDELGRVSDKRMECGGVASLLTKYMKTHVMWWCPCDANKPSRDPRSFTSYEYRVVVAWDTCWWIVKDGDFAYPSRQVVYHEREDWHGGRYGLYQLRGQSKGQPKAISIYADCHARMWSLHEAPPWEIFIYDYHWFYGGGNYEDIRRGWD